MVNKQKDRRKGLKPKTRAMAAPTKGKKLTGNQWQNTPQQLDFMYRWFSPTSDTYSNAYDSAIAAGYSKAYAVKITAPTTANKWIEEYRRNIALTPEHIIQGVETIAKKRDINSRSPDDTRLKAFEQLAGLLGMNNKAPTTVINVQPILGGSSIQPPKRKVIDVDP